MHTDIHFHWHALIVNVSISVKNVCMDMSRSDVLCNTQTVSHSCSSSIVFVQA